MEIKSSNNISDFYIGSKIFITGATGFVGKVLLEKLLRSCHGLEKIYVLIREKKGLNSEQRLKVLLDTPVFDILRKNNPGCLEKIKAIYGDVSEPNLGLSKLDQKLLEDKVNIVFHVAASVRYKDDLQKMLQFNTFGTIQIMEMCKNIKNLKRFIYVSTAYSNCHRNYIEEKVYETPYVPASILYCVNNLPSNIIKMIEKHLMGEYPNNYLFSKALSERVVLEYSRIIPATIVRPPIVHSSWKEPFPGWIEISSGGIAIIAYCAQGLMSSFFFTDYMTADCVPVDIVANTLIAAAWHSTVLRSNTITVYNCTSGEINRLSWTKYTDQLEKYFREYPTINIVFYPNFFYVKNEIIDKILHIFLHYIPTLLIDIYLYFTNQKPIMSKMCQTIAKIFNYSSFAVRIPLTFHVNTFKSLIAAVKNAEDGKNFDIDMSCENGFDWNVHIKNLVLGIRKHILKDDISTLKQARKKINRIYWTTKTIQFISITALITILYLYK